MISKLKYYRALSMIAFLTLAACSTYSLRRDGEGLTALHRAAGEGDLALTQKLIKGGADPNALDSKMGVSVLHKAIYSGDPQVVKLLLDRGALINIQSPSNGDTPLHDALYFKKKIHGQELIELLLNDGASLAIRNRAGFTPLGAAQLLKDKEAVKLIEREMARRFSVKGQNLMTAVKQNKLALVRQMLEDKTISLEEADDQGFTPLLWAAREGFMPMAELLLEHHADPNHLDAWMGANAGHKAAFWGRTEVMALLVKHQLDLNARGLYNGYTPLHDAVAGNHFETAKVLVASGARTDIRGHDGKTPIDIARENGNTAMSQLLGTPITK